MMPREWIGKSKPSLFENREGADTRKVKTATRRACPSPLTIERASPRLESLDRKTGDFLKVAEIRG